MRSSRQWIFAVVTIAVLVSLTGSMLVHATDASISTDKKDYSPGDTVVISGSAFTPSAGISVTVIRPDISETCQNSLRFRYCPLFADSSGSFVQYYALDGIIGSYTVTATDGTNSATTTFTDALSTDWTQCENDHNHDGAIDAGGVCFWGTGNLDLQHNLLAEGNTLPNVAPSAGAPSGQYTSASNAPGHSNQRAIVQSVPDSTTLRLRIRYEFTKAGVKAYDFLTTNYGISDSNLCNQLPSGVTGSTCSSLVASGPKTSTFPTDTTTVVGTKSGDIEDRQTAHDTAFLTGAGGKTALPASEVRKMKIYGLGSGSITSIVNVGITSGSPSGNSEYAVDIFFTKSTGGASTIIATFGAHFAISNLPPAGWGTGNGAGSISGSPFHVTFDGLFDGANTLSSGNRDNQVSVSTVLGVTVACSPSKGTTGKPVSCTATANGGSAPFTFSWSAPGGTPSSGTGSTFSTSYGTPGTYTITVTVTDSRGVSSTSSIMFVINAQPKTLTVDCSTNTAGKPVTCTATSTGGIAPITFSWSAPGGSPSSGTGSSFTTSYSAKGNYTITVTQHDGDGFTTSSSKVVTVSPQPLVVTVDCGSGRTAGKPFSCTVSATGGTSPYSGTGSFTVTEPTKGIRTEAFNVTDSNGAHATGSATLSIAPQPLLVTVDCGSGQTAGKPFTCTVSATGGTAPYSGTGSFTRTEPTKGSRTETFTVTDANGASASGSAIVTVAPQPLVVTVDCPSSGITAGKPFNCTVSATGGTTAYSGTGTFSVTEPTKGTQTETFTVTDANGASASGSATVVVAPQPLVVTVVCSDGTAGKPIKCDVSATGGTTAYTGTGSFSRSFPVKGTYNVCFDVKDANNAVATGCDSVTIAGQPLVVTVICSDGTAGKPIKCDVSASGGTSAYSGTGSFTRSFPVKGSYNVCFDVTDANHVTATGCDTVVIGPQPLVVTVDCGSGQTAGKPFSCVVSATGGTTAYSGTGKFTVTEPVKGDFNECFNVTDANHVAASGCASVHVAPQPLVVTADCGLGQTSGKPFSCTVSATGGTTAYSGAGKFTVTEPVKGTFDECFTVTDANHVSASGCDTVVVAPQPLVVTVDCGSGQTAGKPFSCNVSASGGTTAYSGVGKFTVSEPVKGSFDECFNVTDANHVTATGCDTVVVAPQPLVVTVDCGSGQTAGKPFSCTVSATGGTTAYSGVGKFTVSEPVKGTFDECFVVTDANHVSASGCDTVVVAPQPLVVTVDCGSGQTAGKPFSCTVSASGGTTAYSGIGKFTVTEPVKGTFNECFNVTDANHVTATGCATVNVAPQPLVVTVDCGSGQTAGKPFSCVVSATGGTTAYSGVGKFTVTEPVKGTFDECFNVTDANHVTATGCDTVVVAPQPLVVTVDCGSGQTSGKPFSCTVSATGGTAAYSGTGKFTLTEPVKGSFNECFDVTDANHVTATGCDSVSVAPQPLIVTVDCGSGQTAGKPFSCVVSATGGTTAYSGAGKFTVTEPVKGTFDECFTVTDANHVSASGCDTVVVAPQPLVINASCTNGTAGKPIQCDASASGGTSPYSFCFSAPGGTPSSGCGGGSGGGSGQLAVFVGYADDLRASPFFPTPWAGSANTIFIGSGSPFDAGAIRIDNTGGGPVTIDSVSVLLHGAGSCVPFGNPCGSLNLWGTGIVVPAGFHLILTQTTQYNFDTSDDAFRSCGDVAPFGGLPLPKVTVTVGGVPTVFDDSAHVLDTGGYDFACQGNESLQWRAIGTTGVACPSGTCPSFTTTYSVKGSYIVNATVTDANGVTATTTVKVTITPQPLVITASCQPGTAGKPTDCNASASGGTTPYSFTWDVGKDGVTDGQGAGFTTVFPVKGTFSIDATVTDANGATAFVNLPITVGPQPLVITASCRPGTAGKPTDCNASASGGTTPYSFSWDVGKDGTVDGQDSTFTTVFPVKGSFSIDARVTDANGVTAFVNLPITVQPQPLVITASCQPGTAGKPTNCNASASGGTSPYTFLWDVGKDRRTDGSGPTFTTIFPVKGTYSIDAIVLDSNNATAFVNLPLIVQPQQLVITASCQPGTAGKPTNCSASASGGTGPYAFTWDIGKDGSVDGNGGNFTAIFPVKGSFSIDATVQDANGATAFVNLPIVIRPQPLVITASCQTLTAGKPSHCTASASGGTLPYSFTWDVGKDGIVDGQGSGFIAIFPVKGSYSIDARVTDGNGQSAFVNLPLTVTPQPLVITANCSTGTAGKPIQCSATASGGTGPYSFTWDLGKDGTVDATGPTASFIFPVKGSFSIDATARDSNGAITFVNLPITIRPQPLVADFTSVCTAGSTVSFTATVSGGTGPYTFSWSFGDSTIGGGNPVTHTYATSGSFNVVLTVTDTNGASTQVKKNVKSCGVFFTDTQFCNFDAKPGVPGRQFRYIFIQDPANPSAFKMVATNPGQFYANVIFVGTPGSNETLTVTIPWPFITQGNKPIQVHSAISPTAPGCLGFSDDITSGFTISGLSSVSTAGYPIIVSGDYGGSKGIGSTVTFTVTGTVPPTGMIYITVHLDVKLKGTTGWTKSPTGCTDCNAVNTSLGITLNALQSYTTSAHDTAFSGSDTFQSNNVFKKDPGFAGVVTNAAGTPVTGVKVKIYSPTGLVATVYTDADGVYTYQYKYSGREVTYTITLPDYGISTPVQVKSNRFVLQNFQLTI